MNPRVLVLLSAYNGAAYLRTQAESILDQRGDFSLTLRIRDDGSSDNTEEMVRAMMEEYPGRIEYIKGENMGCNASFFALMDGAEGYDYYALSDHDDKWLPGKIQAAVTALMEEKGPALYACRSTVTDGELNPVGTTREKKRPILPANTLIQNICPGHNQVMNGAMLKLVQQPRQVERIYVYDLWIANLAALYGTILFDNTPRTLYRQHGSNELGYGRGPLGKLKMAGRRALQGEGEKNKRQMAYFAEENKQALEAWGLYEPVQRMLRAKSFRQRLRFTLRCPFYRQSRTETWAFKLAFLLGKY